MKFGFSSLCSIAVLTSSVLLTPFASAADNSDGLVVYNAQHENLVKSWTVVLKIEGNACVLGDY